MHLHRTMSVHNKRSKKHNKKNCQIAIEYYSFGMSKCLLSTVGDWDFNVFNLDKLTNGRALFHISLHLFQEYNFIDTFQLDIVKLMRCISLIEEGYHGINPYHNAVHAADVTQAMHCYLSENKLRPYFTPFEKMVAILAAITHDLDHPGVNQAFLVATSNPLASLYHNTSVLENHHWRASMGVLHESGVFDHFDPTMWQKLEFQLKSIILATDITRQQEYLVRLQTFMTNDDLNLAESPDNRNFMLQIALKCADICNPCRPWEVSCQWSEQVCDEFFRQGDYERKLHLPVTPLCDRYSTTVGKIQQGFMKFVVMPLFKMWGTFNPSQLSNKMLTNITKNEASWEAIVQAADAKENQQEVDIVTIPTVEEEEDSPPLENKRKRQNSDSKKVTVLLVSDDEDDDEEKENSEPAEVIVERPYDSPHEDDIPHFPDCLTRRHSLPPPISKLKELPLTLLERRESMPTAVPAPPQPFWQLLQAQGRRHSLPPSTNSFNYTPLNDHNQMPTLDSLSEYSPLINKIFDFDYLSQKPKITSLSASIDTSLFASAALEGSKQTTAHGLDENTFAHNMRQFTSEPQVSAIAQQGVARQTNNTNRSQTANNKLRSNNQHNVNSNPNPSQVVCCKCHTREPLALSTKDNNEQYRMPMNTVNSDLSSTSSHHTPKPQCTCHTKPHTSAHQVHWKDEPVSNPTSDTTVVNHLDNVDCANANIAGLSVDERPDCLLSDTETQPLLALNVDVDTTTPVCAGR